MAVLQRIREAESQAEEIRAEAQKEARDMLKATESACLQAERAAAVDQRALYQQKLREAQASTEEALAREQEKQAEARAALCKEAEGRIPQAAEMIFRRVTAERS